jgi:integrase
MGERLADVNADLIRDWYAREAKRSPRQAARSAAMFSGFLRWCSLQRELRDLVDARAASSDALRDLLPGKKRRTDALELGQLAAWFAGVAKLSSPVARAYLMALVLTGARREEMAALRWDAVDLRWRKLTIADKVGDTRAIPLTPYLQALIEGLPKATLPDGKPNPYVFAGIGKSGRIAEPRSPHQQVLTDAGIPHVSIHGLRRTFALMGEQAGAPAGAIAQVMGHRPSAVHEGYKPRSIDALRPYLERVESFVLQAAGVDFTQPERRGAGLRLVVGAAG